jgi:hypothetical protein
MQFSFFCLIDLNTLSVSLKVVCEVVVSFLKPYCSVTSTLQYADVGLRRSQSPRGLRRRYEAARYWDSVFESRRQHGCLSLLSVVSYRSLRRADHSSRRVLLTVVRRWVWSRNLLIEEAIAHFVPQRHKKR